VAARAGVYCKRFAVLAEEVRNLTQGSAKAANETTALIKGSIQKVERGSQIANQSAETLAEIIQSISQVSDIMSEIASASSEQVMGIEQISQGLQQIDQVTQTNIANAEESASAADELSDQANQLRTMLQKFSLRNDQSHEDYTPQKRTAIPEPTESNDYQETEMELVNEEHQPKTEAVIALDDNDFGSF